jgi:hypothetical protein
MPARVGPAMFPSPIMTSCVAGLVRRVEEERTPAPNAEAMRVPLGQNGQQRILGNRSRVGRVHVDPS